MRHNTISRAIALTLSFALFAEANLSPLSAATIWQDRSSANRPSTQLAWATPLSPLPLSAKPSLSALRPQAASRQEAIDKVINAVPSSKGRVSRIDSIPGRPVVVHLLDVHQNLEAQKNLSAIVSALSTSGGATSLALEGAFGALNMKGFPAYPHRRALEVAAAYSLELHEISGPIHAMMTAARPLPVTGIDSLGLYQKNVAAYRDAESRADDARSSVASWRVELDDALTSLNPQLADIERSIDGHRSGRVSFGDHLGVLMRHNVPVPEILSRFVYVLRMERSLDTAKAERERSDMIRVLVPRLNAKKLSELTEASLRFRAGRLGASEFYRLIIRICREAGVSLDRYPAFAAYVKYAIEADGLNGSDVLNAWHAYEPRVEDALARTATERGLVAEFRAHRLADALITFALTPADWAALKTAGTHACTLSRSPSGFHADFHRLAGSATPFLDFYRNAELRDAAMASAAIKTAEKTGVAIVVTGGFHADGMDAMLRKARISVVRVEPSLTVTGDGHDSEALSTFTRERTPLEQLVHGHRLFLAPPPAGGIQATAFHATAAAVLEGVPAQTAYDALPSSRDGVTIEATQNGNVVTQNVVDGENRAEIEHEFDRDGKITGHRARFNPVPEIIAFGVLALSMGFFDAAVLFIPVAMAFRFILITSQFLVHEFAHGIAKALTDGTSLRSAAVEALSRLRPASLLPMMALPLPDVRASDLTPRMSVGDETPWKVRIKAAAGIFASLGTAVTAGVAVVLWSSSLGAVLVPVLVMVAAVNALIAVTSWSDIHSVITGTARGEFYCGVFGLVADRFGSDQGLLPARLEGKLRAMGAHTQVRGRQAGGGLVFGRTSRGQTQFIGGKYVNPKRGNLTDIVFRRIKWLAWFSGRKGYAALDTFVGFFHWRFGTSSAPAVLETHWHEWVPAQKKTVWRLRNGAAVDGKETFNIRIVHNGDFDGIEENPNLSVFGRKLDVGDVGTALSRLLWPNATKGDSPKIAGMMTLLATQGMWDASARLAYLLEIEPNLQTVLTELDGPTKIAAHLKTFSDPLEAAFRRHANLLFLPGATSMTQVDRTKVPAFIADAETELLRSSPAANSWTPERRRAFIESALYAFLMNDVQHAVQMFMTMPQKTSTFGLGVVSTLEPEKVVLAAHGQPISLTRSKSEKLHAFASEPAAAISAVANEDAELMDLDDDGGEIAVVTSQSVRLFSISERREIPQSEIENRWIPVNNNPYLSRPDTPGEGENLVRQDLNEVASTLSRVEDEFTSDRSWNRQTADRFAERIIQRAQEAGQRENPEEYDLLLIGEEKSAETTQRFAHDLLQIYPTMKILTITGNDYLKTRSRLFKNKLIGKGTVVLAVSQSGQTFPTLKATRDAQRRLDAALSLEAESLAESPEMTAASELETARKEGLLRDVFVMTGEWYSKMGKTMGQGFHPDDEFGGRIFCNMSGRRRSEASTVATLATDFLLTKILVHTARKMRETFPSTNPFNMTLKTEDIERLNAEARYYLDVSLPSITGFDRYGRELKSAVNQALVAGGKKWSILSLENLTVTLLAVSLVWIMVAWQLMPSDLIIWATDLLSVQFGWNVSAAGFMTSKVLGLSVSSVINATFFAPLVWYLHGLLRLSQGRDFWARTGVRHITITSPVGKTLRNYVKRLYGESLGHFQPQVNAAKAEDLVNYEAASVARGGLLFAQVEDDRPMTESQDQEIAATRMAVNQAWGIQNFGSGLEIIGTNFDPNGKFKFENIPLRTQTEHRAKGLPDKRPDEVHELLTTRFRHTEMMAAGFVFFQAMAEESANFNIQLYKRRTNNPVEWIIAGPMMLLSLVLSRSFKVFYSFVNRVILGGSRQPKLFTVGATQSGTAIATTQMTPDRSSGPSSSRQSVDEAHARKFRANGSPHGSWSPSSVGSRIPWILGHMYADAERPVEEEILSEPPQLEESDENDSGDRGVDPVDTARVPSATLETDPDDIEPQDNSGRRAPEQISDVDSELGSADEVVDEPVEGSADDDIRRPIPAVTGPETRSEDEEPPVDISALPRLYANKRLSGTAKTLRVNFVPNSSLRIAHDDPSRGTTRSLTMVKNAETGEYESVKEIHLRVRPDGSALLYIEPPYKLQSAGSVPERGIYYIQPPADAPIATDGVSIDPDAGPGHEDVVSPETSDDGNDGASAVNAPASIVPQKKKSEGFPTVMFGLSLLFGFALGFVLMYHQEIGNWLRELWQSTPQKPAQGNGRLEVAALPGGLGMAGMLGLGLLGMVGLTGGTRDNGTSEADDIVRFLKELSQVTPGEETDGTVALINAILAGTAVSFGIEQFGTPANAARAKRRAALEMLVSNLDADRDLRDRVFEKIDKPDFSAARRIVDGALFGPGGAPTLRESRAGHKVSDSDLTLVGLRSDLWNGIDAVGKREFLTELAGPRRTSGIGAVIAVESEETARVVRETAAALGRRDISVVVGKGLYVEIDGILKLDVGVLERTAASVVRLDERSYIELIAGNAELDLTGVTNESALRTAVVRLIDASLRVVDQGSLTQVGLAAKAAALISRQA